MDVPPPPKGETQKEPAKHLRDEAIKRYLWGLVKLMFTREEVELRLKKWDAKIAGPFE